MTMKTLPCFLLAAVSLFAAVSSADAQESDRSVILQPKRGAISSGQVFTINFPDAMVAADAIDRVDERAPLSFEPAVEGEFFWKSQTEGRFRIMGPVIPGTKYAVTVRSGLKTLDGQATPALPEEVSLLSAPLTVTANHGNWGDNLPNLPVVPLPP